MSGISTSGIISGIDSAGIIEQLLAISARPRTLAANRVVQLQTQQAAILDINSRLSGLRSAAADFRTSLAFLAKRARSSDEGVVTATARPSAVPGTYNVLVDRLATTQQRLSRGFEDRDTSAVGATSFTFESAQARVDRDTDLSELNGGVGVRRGLITVTDDGGLTRTVDLSRAGTLDEVVDAINTAGTAARARVGDQGLIVENVTAIASQSGFQTAEDLGIAGAADGSNTITGSSVFRLTAATALASLNDGNGVDVTETSPVDLRIELLDAGDAVTGSFTIDLGTIFAPPDPDNPDAPLDVQSPAPRTVGAVIGRINDALSDQGLSTRVEIGPDGKGLRFVGAGSEKFRVVERDGESNTARDLGIEGLVVDGAGAVDGSRVLSGLKTTLLRSLSGGGTGSGPGDGGLDLTLSDGTEFSVDVSTLETLRDLVDTLNANALGEGLSEGDFVARVRDDGLGIELIDNTGGAGNLVVVGSGGASDTAEALGISTGPAGIAGDSVSGNAQRRYIGEGTLLSTLRGGRGIGTGTLEVTTSDGTVTQVTIGDDVRTVRDLLDKFKGLDDIDARINDTGDGLLLSGAGGVGIRISDVSGTVARDLRIAGAADLDGGSNEINGRFETTVEFEATDTLDDVVRKVNEANAGVAVSVLNDGTAGRPFRLSIAATTTGEAGRLTIDTNGFDLGLTTVDEGLDARAFLGSGSVANALLLETGGATLEGVIEGVTIDLNGTSDDFVQLSVDQDVALIEEKIESLVTSFNGVLDRIAFQTRFVEETNERGPLLGDGTLIGLQGAMFNVINGRNSGFNGTFDVLAQVGVTVGEDGQLAFDAARFRTALEEDPEAVEDLFVRRTPVVDDGVLVRGEDGEPVATVSNPLATGRFTELGVVPALEALVDQYSNSVTGILTQRSQSFDTQIGIQEDRIASLGEGLERERSRLEAQFLAMERALAGLQQQQSALASLGGLTFA